MDDFNINIKCKECGSENIIIKAIDRYEGDIILSFTCNDCHTTETYGILDEI